MSYQRGAPDGGLTAAELDGVLATFDRNRRYARSEQSDPSFARFERGIEAGYRMAIEHICAVVGWQCSAGCDQAALFVDADGLRWCNDHLPDGELTITEHDDQRASVDE